MQCGVVVDNFSHFFGRIIAITPHFFGRIIDVNAHFFGRMEEKNGDKKRCKKNGKPRHEGVKALTIRMLQPLDGAVWTRIKRNNMFSLMKGCGSLRSF